MIITIKPKNKKYKFVPIKIIIDNNYIKKCFMAYIRQDKKEYRKLINDCMKYCKLK